MFLGCWSRKGRVLKFLKVLSYAGKVHENHRFPPQFSGRNSNTHSFVKQMHFRLSVSISWEFEASMWSWRVLSKSNWSLKSFSSRWCSILIALSKCGHRKSDEDEDGKWKLEKRGENKQNSFIYVQKINECEGKFETFERTKMKGKTAQKEEREMSADDVRMSRFNYDF